MCEIDKRTRLLHLTERRSKAGSEKTIKIVSVSVYRCNHTEICSVKNSLQRKIIVSTDIKTPITQKMFNDICDRIAESTLSVDKICESLSISNRSFYRYKKIIGDQAEQKYARAKAAQAENLINKINDLHEKMHSAVLTCEDPKRCNALVQAYKVEIDDYKWLASKLLPKAYGDKLQVDMSDTTVRRTIKLPVKVQDGQKVSTYPESSETNNNEKISH